MINPSLNHQGRCSLHIFLGLISSFASQFFHPKWVLAPAVICCSSIGSSICLEQFCLWGEKQQSGGCAGALPARDTTWSSLIPQEEWTRSSLQIVRLLYGTELRQAAKIVIARRIRKDWVFCALSLCSHGCDLELEVKFPVYFCIAHMPHSEQELQCNKSKETSGSSQAGKWAHWKKPSTYHACGILILELIWQLTSKQHTSFDS